MGILTIAFDDGYKDTFSSCLDILDKHDIKATFAVPSSLLGETLENREIMSNEDIIDLDDSGHEIASHTTKHFNLLDLYNYKGIDAVREDLNISKKELEDITTTKITSFVFPYIDANNNRSIRNSANDRYDSFRITTDFPSFNFLPTKSNCLIGSAITTDYTLNDLNKTADILRDSDMWLIEVFHLVANNNTKSAHRDEPYRYFTPIETFNKHIEHLIDIDLTVMTQREAFSEYGRIK